MACSSTPDAAAKKDIEIYTCYFGLRKLLAFLAKSVSTAKNKARPLSVMHALKDDRLIMSCGDVKNEMTILMSMTNGVISRTHAVVVSTQKNEE
jgi:hypothetical protein